MALKKETQFYNKVKRDLKKLPSTKFTKIQQVGRVGDPDIMMCVNGWYVEIEMKKDGRTWPDPLQHWNLQETNRCGGFGFVAFPANWDVVYDFLLYISGMNLERPEVPRCLKLRQLQPGPKPSKMPLPES